MNPAALTPHHRALPEKKFVSEKFISNRDNTEKGLNPGVILKISGASSSYYRTVHVLFKRRLM